MASSGNKLFKKLYGNIQADLFNEMLSAEEKLLLMYQQSYDSIMEELDDLYRKYSVDGVLSHAEMSKYNRLKNLEKQLSEKLLPQFRKKDAYLKKFSSVMYEESFYQHAYAIDMGGGAALKWGMFREEDIEAITLSPLSKLSDSKILSSQRVKDVYEIRKAITVGMVRGDAYPKMARRIQEVLGLRERNGKLKSGNKGLLYQSMRVARTEGQRAAVEGQMRSYKKAAENGVELEEVWDAALDGRTRPEHGALDGKVKQDKGWYVPSIGWVTGPLQSGVAGFDIHCRCRVRGQIKDYPPKVRGVKGTGQQPWTDYASWKKAVSKKGSAKSVTPSRVEQRVQAIANLQSMKELEEFVRKTGYAEKVNFENIPLGIAKDWATEIVRQYERIPDLQPMKFLGTTQARNRMLKDIYRPDIEDYLKRAGLSPGTRVFNRTVKRILNQRVQRIDTNVLAQKSYNPHGYGIAINKIKAKDRDVLIQRSKEMVDSGWFSKGDPTYHIVSHEMGHEVDALLGLSKNQEILAIINRKRGEIPTAVSYYGSTNVAETIAEVWAEYTTGENPRPFVKEVGDKIMEVYAQWKQKR